MLGTEKRDKNTTEFLKDLYYEENKALYLEREKTRTWIRLNFGKVAEAQLDAYLEEVEEQDEEIEELRDEAGNLRYTLRIMRDKLKELGVDPDSLDPRIKENEEDGKEEDVGDSSEASD